MLFNRNYNLKSNKNIDALKSSLIGEHIKVHALDYEASVKGDIIRIIPHAENEDGVLTLPIVHLQLSTKNNGTQIKFKSHPRRIDIGGPYLLMVISFFAIVAGIVLHYYGGPQNSQLGWWVAGAGLFIAIAFWIKMELGYFDYVRKIKAWVKSKL